MTDIEAKKNVREELTEVQSEIAELRDTLRLRAHLAGLEVKQRLDELETRFYATRQLAHQIRDDARDDLVSAAHAGLAEVKKGVRQIRASLEAPKT
jgi:hypothetical protein